MRRFIGSVNFYRQHLRNAASTQAPLNEFLKNAKKNNIDEIKRHVAESTLLAHPIPRAKLRITTDASSTAIGAVLEQEVGNNWKTLSFYSKKRSPVQTNYSTYDRELTAIYNAIKNVQPWVEGRDFSIRTDHKSLIFAFQQRSDKASPRQVRQLNYISQFTTNLQYIAGSENNVTDALSRIDAINHPSTMDFEELAETQKNR